MMKVSQLHLAFTNYTSAVRFFKTVFNFTPEFESQEFTLFKCEGLDLVFKPDWGEGDTMMVLKFASLDADHDYEQAIENGARTKFSPVVRDNSIIGSVFGPGKIVIEFEQPLLKFISEDQKNLK